ncbi:MAG: DUF3224 domain-containing protein [Gammaproteobacteria bacterium]|nr:DUF3224 domain-containing protein [Gammaproteobacteria bacterium]
MKHLKIFLITMIMAVIMMVISSPVMAGPPETVQGVMSWTSIVLDERVSGRNVFLKTFEDAVWTGSLSGTSTEDGIVVLYGLEDNDPASYHGIASFEGEVFGKSGTLEILILARVDDVFSDWEGTWVILSGTGELSNLRGRGTLIGPGPIDYKGMVHFEP